MNNSLEINPRHVLKPIGEIVVLKCSIDCDTTYWRFLPDKGYEYAKFETNISIKQSKSTSQLVIERLRLKNEGQYYCFCVKNNLLYGGYSVVEVEGKLLSF